MNFLLAISIYQQQKRLWESIYMMIIKGKILWFLYQILSTNSSWKFVEISVICRLKTGNTSTFAGYRLFSRPIDWLKNIRVDWLIDRSIDWLIDWLNDYLIDWLTDWLIHWLHDWLIDWLIDCLNERKNERAWLAVWLIDWLIDWLQDTRNQVRNKSKKPSRSLGW